MRRLILTITGVLILVSSGFCQVDTLMLVEINNFEIVDDITNLFIEDLNGDSIKELIICTDHFIYIYNSMNNDLIWTSPALVNPEDLMFKDINHDGLLDLSIKDSLNIHLFDPHNYNTIWTSPALDSTYKCYTVGDRNDDGWLDVAIVNKIPTDTTIDFDTSWIKLYNGSSFLSMDSTFILMPWYDSTYYMRWWGVHESPSKIIIDMITEENNLINFIFMYTSYGSYYYEPTVGGSSFSGRLHLINAITFNNYYVIGTGFLLYYNFVDENDSIYLYSLNSSSTDGVNISNYKKYTNRSTGDTTFCSVVWSNTYDIPDFIWGENWRGFSVGDLTDEYTGDEVCFSFKESLELHSIPSFYQIWANSDTERKRSVLSLFKSDEIFESPSILCEFWSISIDPIFVGYGFYSIYDGSFIAYLSNPYINISKACDLDSDDNYELLSIQDNSLHIYHLDYYVDIDNPEILPHTTFIQPNYPNPFNTSTTIEYGLSHDAFVTVNIYDLLGRKVETLVSKDQPAGLHHVTWHVNDKPSGIYFYKIQAGEYTKTKKMLLLK